ncbi:hypothetical protein LCGC14_2401210, partial [marine sediment metagenome]
MIEAIELQALDKRTLNVLTHWTVEQRRQRGQVESAGKSRQRVG